MNTLDRGILCSTALLLCAMLAHPQQPAQQPAAPTPPNDGKVRVYVSDSQSWQMVGGWGLAGHQNADGSGEIAGAGHMAGGARPQTAEIIKTFNERCSDLTITNNKDKAKYAVILDHEGGKGLLKHRNKIVVFNRDGDSIFSGSTPELGNAVKDGCVAIRKDAGLPANPVANSKK